MVGVLVMLPPQESPPPEGEARVWELPFDAIERIELTGAEGTWSLAWKDEAWVLFADEELPADPSAAHEVVDALADLRFGVPLEDADPVVFGLEPPRVAITVQRIDGASDHLAVGRDVPIDRLVYVRTDAGVFATSADLRPVIEASPDVVRDRAPFRFAPETVEGFFIEGPEGRLMLARDADGWWIDGFSRADPRAVDRVVGALLDLRAEGPGGGEPSEVVWTVRIDHGGTSSTTTFGPPGEEVQGWSDRIGPVRFDPATLAVLGAGPPDLGPSVSFPLEGATEVEIRGDAPLRAILRDGRWIDEAGQEQTAAIEALAAVPMKYRRETPEIASDEGSIVIGYGDRRRTFRIGPRTEAGRVVVDAAGGSPWRVDGPIPGFDDR